MNMLSALPLLAFPVLLIVAALKDVVSFTIPNWISAALLLAFPVAALAAGMGWGEASQHAAVGGVALLVGMGLFALNWMGGGDAKLLSAAALWLGPAATPSFVMSTALVGGALALALIAARKAHTFVPVAPNTGWVQALLNPKGDIPYGVAICIGALLAFPLSSLFSGALSN